jgi:hypothetical protein
MSTHDLSPEQIDLPDIAVQIRHELQQGAQHAARAGALLAQAKTALPHGQWLPWLANHCQMSDRVAQNYMRLAKKMAALPGSNTNRDSYLPIRKALKQLATPRPAPDIAEYRRLRDEILGIEDIEALHTKMPALYRLAMQIIDTSDDIAIVAELTDGALIEHIQRLRRAAWPESIGPAPTFMPLPGHWMVFADDDVALWIVPAADSEGYFHLSKLYWVDGESAFDGTRRPIAAWSVELNLQHWGVPNPSALPWLSHIGEPLLRPFGEPEKVEP